MMRQALTDIIWRKAISLPRFRSTFNYFRYDSKIAELAIITELVSLYRVDLLTLILINQITT